IPQSFPLLHSAIGGEATWRAGSLGLAARSGLECYRGEVAHVWLRSPNAFRTAVVPVAITVLCRISSRTAQWSESEEASIGLEFCRALSEASLTRPPPFRPSRSASRIWHTTGSARRLEPPESLLATGSSGSPWPRSCSSAWQ